MRETHKALITVAVCVAISAATAAAAHAASYERLKSQGYETGQLTRAQSGAYGWILSGAGKRYFCRMDATVAYVGSTEMVAFTSSGRQIALDRAVYERSLGNKKAHVPQMSDLKAGRPDPRDVGRCRRLN